MLARQKFYHLSHASKKLRSIEKGKQVQAKGKYKTNQLLLGKYKIKYHYM
jgi:hypothetical protein